MEPGCGGAYATEEEWRAALERYPRVNATVFNVLDFTCELMSPFLDTFAKEQKITTCLNEGM